MVLAVTLQLNHTYAFFFFLLLFKCIFPYWEQLQIIYICFTQGTVRLTFTINFEDYCLFSYIQLCWGVLFSFMFAEINTRN